MGDLFLEDLDSAPCAFFSFSDDGIIQSANQTFSEVLMCQGKHEIIGSNIAQFLTMASKIFYQTHLYPLVKLRGNANEIFITLKTKTGESIPVICNVKRKKNESGFTNHCMLFVITERGKYETQLISARKIAEEALVVNNELVEAKKELEIHSIELDRQLSRQSQLSEDRIQFSKVISHDMQESIRKVALLTNRIALRRKDADDDETKQFGKVSAECENLSKLAFRLQRFINLNFKTEEFSEINLFNLIHSAYQKSSEVQTRAGVNLKLGNLLPFEGLSSQIELLFFTVFENFLRFFEQDEHLNISIDSHYLKQNSYRTIKGKYRYVDFLKIEILGKGKGFDRWSDTIFQLVPKTENKFNDVGFGFAFCKKIVDNHYGKIESTMLKGTGVEIVIYVPLKQ